MLVTFIKEFIESIIRNFRKMMVENNDKSVELLKQLSSDGIVSESGFLTSEECTLYINKIEQLLTTEKCRVWVDDEKSDHRIYFINTIDIDFNLFYEHPRIRNVLKLYTGTENPLGMLLAAKIEYKDGNLGSGGGWHRDSPITHQFKAICYLNDVDEDNGPFQYIKGSHRKGNVLFNYVNKVFKPSQYRFNKDEIEVYLEKNGKNVESVTGKAGTLVYADTKGIHRGKPLTQGVRYVLFCYFWHDKIPEHFESLKQIQ